MCFKKDSLLEESVQQVCQIKYQYKNRYITNAILTNNFGGKSVQDFCDKIVKSFLQIKNVI